MVALASVGFHADAAGEVIAAWYPLRLGDSWVYEKASLGGDMARPSGERWRTEETIVGARPLPGVSGTLLTKRVRVRDHTMSSGFVPANAATRREQSESHLLVRGNCLYVLDGIDANGGQCAETGSGGCVSPLDADGRVRPVYQRALQRGDVPADFCFPIVRGTSWGATRTTNEFVWAVQAENADPFGIPDGHTFHLSSRAGSGSTIDRWFAEGVGVLQEVIEHHGTYDEQRRQLVSATIDGRTTRYGLRPARTTPVSKGDCTGPGWRHFTRGDGTPFSSEPDCARDLAR